MNRGLFYMVGTTRFELATSRTPTNLRVNHRFSKALKTNQNQLYACNSQVVTRCASGKVQPSCNQVTKISPNLNVDK